MFVGTFILNECTLLNNHPIVEEDIIKKYKRDDTQYLNKIPPQISYKGKRVNQPPPPKFDAIGNIVGCPFKCIKERKEQ